MFLHAYLYVKIEKVAPILDNYWVIQPIWTFLHIYFNAKHRYFKINLPTPCAKVSFKGSRGSNG